MVFLLPFHHFFSGSITLDILLSSILKLYVAFDYQTASVTYDPSFLTNFNENCLDNSRITISSAEHFTL